MVKIEGLSPHGCFFFFFSLQISMLLNSRAETDNSASPHCKLFISKGQSAVHPSPQGCLPQGAKAHHLLSQVRLPGWSGHTRWCAHPDCLLSASLGFSLVFKWLFPKALSKPQAVRKALPVSSSVFRSVSRVPWKQSCSYPLGGLGESCVVFAFV